MVRAIDLGVAIALLAGGVSAAAPDWRAAGGNLFVAGASAPGRRQVIETQAASVGDASLPALHQPFDAAVADAAARHGLDPKLLHALVIVESAYRPEATSPVGAGGLTQLMPATAAALGVEDRFSPEASLSGGADYLARQLLRFGDLRLALAAYNAGPGRVSELGRVPDIAETRAYVNEVIDCYLALSAGRGVRTASQCRSTGVPP